MDMFITQRPVSALRLGQNEPIITQESVYVNASHFLHFHIKIKVSRLPILVYMYISTYLHYYGPMLAQAAGRNWSSLNKRINKRMLVVIRDFFRVL